MAEKSAALQILSKKKKTDDTVDTIVTDSPQVTMSEEALLAPAPTSKIKVKTKAKTEGGTTVAETKTKTKAVTDEIADTASAIENLTETAAFKELTDLLHAQAFDEFRMGGILSKIQTEQWFGEHPNFRSLVEAEFGIKYRTAMMWVGMYNDLVESGVAWDKLKPLGWTKIALLATILTTDNVEDVLGTVDGMNAMQIQAYVAAFNTGDATSTSVPADVNDLKSKTFKLFSGQKETVDLAIEKAKKDTGSDSDGFALEMICTDYVAGSKKKTEQVPGGTTSMPTTMAEFIPVFQNVRAKAEDLQTGLTEILQAINEVYPEAQIQVELEEPA